LVDHDEAREKTALFGAAIAGAGVAPADAGGRPLIELFRAAWTNASHTHPAAARLGEPQRDPDHFRPRPASLRR
jgi:hypothetical protein